MALAAGTLTSRVILQQATLTSDSAGGSTAVWGTVATPWAKVVQTGGGEQMEDGQTVSRRTFDVTMRRRTTLLGSYRVCWGAVVMNVVSVRQDDEDREVAVLSCVEDPGAAR